MFKQLVLVGLCFLAGLGCSAMAGGHRTWANSTQDTDLPKPEQAKEKAPEKFKVKVATTKGDFVIQVTRDWSPNGADRFYNLVKIGYFKDIAIFRAIEGFMFQFGIHGDPAVNAVWSEANIKDDPVGEQSNLEGMITFAKTGAPNSRSVQFFVNLGHNARLDKMGFTPFGKVVEGADVLKQINSEYGENDPSVQDAFQKQGNDFIFKKYPKLDVIQSITLVDEP